ncbi:MAG: hypothetical protein F4X72_14675 [Dehalococcoidia bacterium]|nr:hypothetical protein [Dehalococcoidia bacterium]
MVAQSGIQGQGWSRAGAHNIAGVSFQVAVTASLILDGRAGVLPLARATPEGFEDIDVEFRDETRALVQVKERSPSTVFGRSDFVKGLTNKAAVLEEDSDCRFVLATNAELGGGLSATGWGQTLSQRLPSDEVDKLATLLEGSFDHPYEILARSHIVRVERSVVEENRRDFARIPDLHPSIAALAYAQLIEQVTEVAIRQRYATPETAEWIASSAIDALVKRLLEVVDVDSLDEAVTAGIVEPLDFNLKADLSPNDFLAGVDVLPSHIGADLDLPRPTELDALVDALQERHSALLTGPSGAGKSALLWRTARRQAGHVRPYRLLRLLREDVPTLSRWIRLQEPSKSYPLLICGDNLGRPDTAGWTAIAREFIDHPGVLLLGACREEDYHPELAIGRTTVVDPKLDRDLATSIGATLANSQVPTVLDIDEAFEASEGLLMEFLSMLLTGQRLQQVVEQQVAARLTEERATEREIFRYVATAHAAGVPLPADVLTALIPDKDLTGALALLDREHILISDDASRWQGLHELRSAIARDYIHRFPPPTAGTTIAHLVKHLPARQASRVIEAYARLDSDLEPAAKVVAEILNSGNVNPQDGTLLVTSLAMADAFRHARECLHIVEDLRPDSIDPAAALLFAYSERFAGVSFDSLKGIGPGFAYLAEMAAALPPRPTSLRDLCLRDLASATVLDIATRGTADQAITWLESLEGSDAIPAVSIEELWEHFSEASLKVTARLSATLRALAIVVDAESFDELFGSFDDRLSRLSNDLPDCVGICSLDESDGKVVTLRLLVPDDESLLNDWCSETCRLILNLFPEADIAEVTVVTPQGDRYSVHNFEPGHKRIPRSNLPRSPETAVNANFLRAGRLLLASKYWTEPIRILANTSRQLLELQNDAVSWLINPRHNTRRRREATKLASNLGVQLAGAPKEPVADGVAEGGKSALEAMSDALTVVRDIAAKETPEGRDLRSLGYRCRGAVERLAEARRSNLPSLSTVGDPFPDSLDDMLTLLADVLLASVEHPALVKRLRRHGSESWVEVARRFVNEAATLGYQTEREALEEALATTEADFEIRQVVRPDLKSVRLLTDWWVILVPAEGSTSAEGDEPAPLPFFERLPADMAEQLAFRTFLVFGAAGRLLPLHAVKLGGSRVWPANEEDLSTIALGLDMEVMESTHLQVWDLFAAELVKASRAASLLRRRQQAGLNADQDDFMRQLASARKAAQECHPLLHSEANLLLERVEHEASSDIATLAEEMYRSLTHEELSEDLTAMLALRVGALSIDI